MEFSGALHLSAEPKECRVVFCWAATNRYSTKEQILAALAVAAKNGAILCRLAVSKPFPPSSELGFPPHLRTGAGRASITWGVDRENCIAWVGSSMHDFNYMCWHDAHGRPWLFDTLKRHHRRLQRDVETRLN